METRKEEPHTPRTKMDAFDTFAKMFAGGGPRFDQNEPKNPDVEMLQFMKNAEPMLRFVLSGVVQTSPCTTEKSMNLYRSFLDLYEHIVKENSASTEQKQKQDSGSNRNDDNDDGSDGSDDSDDCNGNRDDDDEMLSEFLMDLESAKNDDNRRRSSLPSPPIRTNTTTAGILHPVGGGIRVYKKRRCPSSPSPHRSPALKKRKQSKSTATYTTEGR